MEQLKSRLREKQRVPVAVFSTPAAEAALARTGLSIVDLLRPVSLVNNLNGGCIPYVSLFLYSVSKAQLQHGDTACLPDVSCCCCVCFCSAHACGGVLHAGAGGAAVAVSRTIRVPAGTRGMSPYSNSLQQCCPADLQCSSSCTTVPDNRYSYLQLQGSSWPVAAAMAG